MSRLVRSPIVVAFLVVLVLGATALVYWPFWEKATTGRGVPLLVPEGDQEVAWLNNATSGVAWERFVAAVRRLAENHPELELKITDDTNAFPSHTTAVSELAVSRGAGKGSIWFRWYKLTADTGPGDWVKALAQRNPPPLAIIGGSSSDRARDLARELNGLQPKLTAPPLLLITTATADQVDREEGGHNLMALYPGRSFRFCFTNRQMADTVSEFVWQHPELRPDAEPVYSAHWEDDPYSEDLFERFHEVLGPERFGGQLRNLRLAEAASRDVGWLGGHLATEGILPALNLKTFCPSPAPYWSMPIPFSVGNPNQPNRWEVEAAEKMMDERGRHLGQQRPLLVLPANPKPAHRFLRALVRTSALEAAHFIVATGDAIDFDTVYRDRNLKWPIQDLPFALVLFCHRNPVDPTAFQPDRPGSDNQAPNPNGKTSTGTQDLMLYEDIVETLMKGAFSDSPLVSGTDALRQNIQRAQLPDGRNRFDEEGNQRGGGEFVVLLQPIRPGDRVLPRSRLQVWNRTKGFDDRPHWERVAVDGMAELLVDYTPGQPMGGG